MTNFKVVFEIEVNAQTSLEAAKTVQGYLENPNDKWQYYVMNEDTMQVDSVDLEEDDSDAVIENVQYLPLIR